MVPSDDRPLVIRFSKVSKRYPNGTGPALDEVSFHVGRGEFLFLTGHSGAGKSTLLKLMYADERPTQGEVRVSGFAIGALRPDEVSRLRRRLGIIFQDFRLLDDRTAAENIAFALEVTGHRAEVIPQRVTRALVQVGLALKADSFPRELSGGEQQRVAIARALVNDPPVLLADEPTGNLDEPTAALDPERKVEVVKVLAALAKEGTTMVIVTHEPAVVQGVADVAITLQRGRVVR